VVQFEKEASQTRDYCVAKNATHRPPHHAKTRRAGGPASHGSPRSLAAQELARDDKQTAPLLGKFALFDKRQNTNFKTHWPQLATIGWMLAMEK